MKDMAKQEILEAIGEFAGQVDQKFVQIDHRFDGIEKDLVTIKATMVTKSYLDDKFADSKGNTVSMLRKEDQKVNRLISVMTDKGSLTPAEAQDVLSFRPFP
jgi:hypothetical protein